MAMHPLKFGEGTTPREIADPDRFPAATASAPTAARRRWAMAGTAVLALLAILYFNPLMGSRTGHVMATDAHFSSGYHLGFGSPTIFAFKGQKLHLAYHAKVQSGSLVVHVWPTGLPALHSSIRTIRIEHNENAKCAIVLPYTGFYRIEIDTFRRGRSYDVDYEISWRTW